jgi:hypothetical protein
MEERLQYALESYKDVICDQMQRFVEELNRIEDIENAEVYTNFFKKFPFVELIYVLDEKGIQITNNVVNPIFKGKVIEGGKGKDRSSKLYYQNLIKDPKCKITKPYISIATGKPSATVSLPVIKEGKLKYVFAADLSLENMLFQSKKEKSKILFERITKLIYSIFSLILIGLSFKLGYAGINQIIKDKIEIQHIFESVILITLALAIFDLAKTIFEEEVILFKDPRRHSEIRKTLTRFLASIIVAIAIEGLMLVFKFTMTDPQKLFYAFGIFISIALLIIAMGIYVFLGTKSEITVKEFNKKQEV